MSLREAGDANAFAASRPNFVSSGRRRGVFGSLRRLGKVVFREGSLLRVKASKFFY